MSKKERILIYIENYKYFSEAVRYNEIKLSIPEGGHLKW